MKIRRLLFLHSLFTLLVLGAASKFAKAQETRTFTLEEVVQHAKNNSAYALRIKTIKENSYWQIGYSSQITTPN